MLQLRISVHEFKTPQGAFLGMNAGEFTGVFAPLPVSLEDQEGMKKYVQDHAEYYMTMAPDTELTNGEDIPLGEIQESIRANIVKSCHVLPRLRRLRQVPELERGRLIWS